MLAVVSFPTESTCEPWAVPADIPATIDVSGLDDQVLLDSMQIASDILFDLTGRRWPGACPTTVRPQAQFRPYRNDVPRWWPVGGVGYGSANLWGWCSCQRGRASGCNIVPEIRLPGGPVDASTVTVKIDGVPFTDFAIHDGRWLVRTDGEHGWPCCQDMTLSDDEPSTWSVTYTRGGPPPIGGHRAAAVYGAQLALAFAGDKRCKLPERVTTITRQGTAMTVIDPQTFLKDGLTGIAQVDVWIGSIWTGRRRRRATVLVPGRSRPVRRPAT